MANDLSSHKGRGKWDIFPYRLLVLPRSEPRPEPNLSMYPWGARVSKPWKDSASRVETGQRMP